MKTLKRVMVVLLAMLAVAAPAEAQFRWGVKLGTNINKLTLSKSNALSNFDGENRAGFTGGLTTEFTVPIIGLAFDASLMYTHRVNSAEYSNDYISVPINLKYKFGFPVISSFLLPYVFTGPEFAVLCSKKAVETGVKNKSFDTNWNLGVGAQLINHLQIAASYGFGISKNLTYEVNGEEVSLGRNKLWTITAAWLF